MVPQVCKLTTPVIIRASSTRGTAKPPPRRNAAVQLRPLPVRVPVAPLVLWLHLRRPCFACSLIMCTLGQYQWRALVAPRKHDCPF